MAAYLAITHFQTLSVCRGLSHGQVRYQLGEQREI